MILADLLAKHLKEKNISAVAREIKVPVSLLHDWVRGRRSPSLKNIGHLKSLARFLGLSLGELLGDSSTGATLVTQVDFSIENQKYLLKIEKKQKLKE
jgi:hypothetical protein